jgi:D-glycero-D-manno-heptose 1,7-bisphosphate phosphatase
MNSKLDLLILCGGKGSRLGNITKFTPKPLLKIDNTRFVELLINFYKKFDIDRIFLLTCYKKKKFEVYDNSYVNFIKIKCISEKKPLGTGGAIFNLKSILKKNFILINGDSYFDYDYLKFTKNFNTSNEICRMLMVKNTNYFSNKKLFNISLTKNKEIIYKKNSKFMNSGIYLFKKKIFNLLDVKKVVSLENEIFPLLIKNKKLTGQIQNGYFIDIGTKKNLGSAKKNLIKNINKKSIILDRDGVINYDYGYVHKYQNFRFKPGVIMALKYLYKKSIKIFITTNQSGIGRGLYSEKDFIKLHKKIKSFFSKKKIFIDDVKYCPHHPKFAKKEFKKNCNCRKPKNGMIKKIIKENCLDKKKIIMIGDKKSDMLSAKKSNIKFFYAKKNLYKQISKIY